MTFSISFSDTKGAWILTILFADDIYNISPLPNNCSAPCSPKIVLLSILDVTWNEIEKVNNYLRLQAEPDYIDEILNFADEKEIGENFLNKENKDELYQSALEIIKSEGKASTSLLQRKLQIGYNRAARIIDMMEAEGIVSKANHVGKRDVL